MEQIKQTVRTQENTLLNIRTSKKVDDKKNKNIVVKKGDIILVDMEDAGIGSEQCGKTRPCLVIQNDIGNHYSPTTIVAVGTSKINKKRMNTQLIIESSTYTALKTDTLFMLEQIRVIDKSRIKGNIFHLSDSDIEKANECIKFSLAL